MSIYFFNDLLLYSIHWKISNDEQFKWFYGLLVIKLSNISVLYWAEHSVRKNCKWCSENNFEYFKKTWILTYIDISMYIKKYSYNFNSKKYICKVILGFERIVQEFNWIFFLVCSNLFLFWFFVLWFQKTHWFCSFVYS